MNSTDRENGVRLQPRFDKAGLVTAVVVEVDTREPLMVAHMNEEALKLSIETREAHFFSRSRQSLWRKGETSGNVLKIAAMRVDCDQDAIWIEAEIAGRGAACHTGRKSCFYRDIHMAGNGSELRFNEK